MSVLAWLAVVVGGLLGLLLVVLALLLLVPVAVDAAWSDERRAFALTGPGARVAFDVPSGVTELWLGRWRAGRWARGEERARRGKRGERRARARPSARKLWAQRRRLSAALRAFLRRVRVRRLALEATLASPDPAVTGWLLGAAHAGLAVAPEAIRSRVRVRPDFAAEAPRLAVDASVRVQPVRIALLALRVWAVVRRASSARPPRPRPVGVLWRRLRAARRRGAAGRTTGRWAAGGSSGRANVGSDRRDGGGRKRP